ncbi:MAG: hypothetical protein ACRD3D_13540 [Terriglobia bacterium]
MKRVFAALLCAGLPFVLASGSVHAQAIADQALAVFPPDTQQIAYTNFADLRSMPNYRQIAGAVLDRQVLYFENFLRSIGIDPEKDVDEVMAGWRGDPSHSSALFGLAAGRFDPAAVESFIAREHLAQRPYNGFILYASGSGVSSEDLFFVFLNPGMAAFGHLTDLEYLIDAYQGQRPTLASKGDFKAWMGELEDSAPEWGITTGKAALALIAPWIEGSQKADLARLLAPVRAVLYSVGWQGGFSTHVSVVCDNAPDAQTLARLLMLLKYAASVGGEHSAAEASLLQSFAINPSGSRVEIEGSGPPDAFAQAIRGARAP